MLDITTLAAWGEFIGGIAVVVSLIYLASQIRQNSRLLRASAASATAQTQLGQTSVVVGDAELGRISTAGLADLGSLSEADRQRFGLLMSIQIRGHQQLFRMAREGVLSRESWGDEEQQMRFMTRQSGFQEWWPEWRHLYSDDFCSEVDGLIRERAAVE
jgi:hypothetical protein